MNLKEKYNKKNELLRFFESLLKNCFDVKIYSEFNKLTNEIVQQLHIIYATASVAALLKNALFVVYFSETIIDLSSLCVFSKLLTISP